MFGGWKWPLGLTSWLVTSDDNSPVIDAYKQVYGSITNIPVFFLKSNAWLVNSKFF